MGKLSNISIDQVKDFLKNNIFLCIFLVFDIVLFFSAIRLGTANTETESKVDALSLQKNQIENILSRLSTINKDYEFIQEFKVSFLKKCVNFGKKTSVYKFLTQISDLFPTDSNLNLSIVKSYNITKNQSLLLDQDLQAFEGDNICVDYALSFVCPYSKMIQIINDMGSRLNYFARLKQVEIKNMAKDDNLSVNLVYTVLGKIHPKGNDDA